jgi:hypothetical protein
LAEVFTPTCPRVAYLSIQELELQRSSHFSLVIELGLLVICTSSTGFRHAPRLRLKTEAESVTLASMRIIRAETSPNRTTSYYFTSRSRLSSELRPAKHGDGEHIHLMTQVSTVVLAGEAEVLNDGKWQRIGVGEGAIFDTWEPHDIRTREDSRVLDLNGIAENIVAVTMTERIVPPSLDIFEDEIDLVVREDRFDSEYLSNPKNTDYWSKGLRIDSAKSQRFWEILERNRKKLDSLNRVLKL